MFRASRKLAKAFHPFIWRKKFSSLSQQQTDIGGSFGNTVYIEQMYNLWLKNPEKVDPSWHQYFKELQDEEILESQQQRIAIAGGKELTAEEMEKMRQDAIRIYFYIRSFNKRGHEFANLDPLRNYIFLLCFIFSSGMDKATQEQSGVKVKITPELDPKFYGFSEADLDKEFPISEKKIAVNINLLRKFKK